MSVLRCFCIKCKDELLIEPPHCEGRCYADARDYTEEQIAACYRFTPPNTRQELARRLAVVTPLTAADIEADLCLVTDPEIEHFLAPDADMAQVLDLVRLRKIAARAALPPGPGGLSYPALQLFPLPDALPLPNGAHRSVRGSRGWYTICNHGGRLACDCPAFAFSKEPQTCKHLRGLRPAIYVRDR